MVPRIAAQRDDLGGRVRRGAAPEEERAVPGGTEVRADERLDSGQRLGEKRVPLAEPPSLRSGHIRTSEHSGLEV